MADMIPVGRDRLDALASTRAEAIAADKFFVLAGVSDLFAHPLDDSDLEALIAVVSPIGKVFEGEEGMKLARRYQKILATKSDKDMEAFLASVHAFDYDDKLPYKTHYGPNKEANKEMADMKAIFDSLMGGLGGPKK